MRTNKPLFTFAMLTFAVGMLFFYLCLTMNRQQNICTQSSTRKRENRPVVDYSKERGPDSGRHILFVNHNNNLDQITRYPLPKYSHPQFSAWYKTEYAPPRNLTTDFCGLNSVEELNSSNTVVEPLQYSDISVMIYVGKNSYLRSLYWRLMMKDTFPDAIIVSSAYSPIQEIALTLLPGIGEIYASNTPKHILGLATQYYTQPGRKWYYAGGDDTFIRSEMFKRTLEKYDSQKPIWLGTLGYTSQSVPYLSGGAGVAMSRKLVEMLIGWVPFGLSVVQNRFSDVYIGNFIWEYAKIPPTTAFNLYSQPPETVVKQSHECPYNPMLTAAYHYIKTPDQHATLFRAYLQDLKILGKLPQSFDVDAKMNSLREQYDVTLAKYANVTM